MAKISFPLPVATIINSTTGLPAGADWEELAAKTKFTSAQLTAAKKIRGPLNVPRERFQLGTAGRYLTAKP